MATDPPGPAGYGSLSPADEGSDIDAEGEEEYETPQDIAGSHADAESTRDHQEGQEADAGGGQYDEDAEGEEDEELQGEAVGAVKIPLGHSHILSEEEEEEEEEDNDGEVDAAAASESEAQPSASDATSDSESDTSNSEVGNEWEGESEDADDAPDRATDSKPCVFCGQSEDDDPNPHFEEFLSCAVCGDGSHRQCARDANTLGIDEDAEKWRCSNCVENGVEPDYDGATERKASIPKIARDLLPVKPDAASIYNELILADDPLDGTRALRKRKGSPEEAESISLRSSTRKRRRGSTAASTSSAHASTPRSPGSRPTSRHTRSGAAAGAESADEELVTRSTRPRRTVPQKHKPGATVVHDGINLIVSIRVKNKHKLAKILSSRPRRRRGRDRPRKTQPAYEEPEPSHYPAIENTNFQPFFAFTEREDDTKSKPYGGILSEADADTTRTNPQDVDKKRFEDARKKAEEDWKKKMAAIQDAEPARPAQKMSGPPSKIKCINFGGYEIDTWHAAPYPEEYSRNKVLYICEFCLKYMNSDYVAWRHKLKCPAKHPPGDEIYRDGKYSFFEVDGRKNPVYCQNLCLLAKLFLGSKTLYYDVEPFLFYVMTENNEFGCHFVGYFSKEKRPSSLNNVSCILVLPIHQRKGFGHMLIEFSYLLTREEKKTGSPEKPLSDMGLVSYRSYWRLILCYQLLHQRQPLSIAQISERTGMTADDIVSALEGLRALVRDPVTKTYAFRLDHAYFKQFIDKFEEKQWPKIKPENLIWTPYIMGRGNMSHYDDGPQLHAVAPREEETNEEAVPEEGIQMAMAAAAAAAAAEAEEASAVPLESDEARHVDMPDASAPAINGELRTQSRPSTPKGDDTVGAPVLLPPSITPAKHPASDIPPTRFEVFPPIPGQPPVKRRPGRPFGTRRRTTTPLRRSHTAPGGKNLTLLSPSRNVNVQGLGINGVASARRTRSKLGEVVNGISGEDEEEDEKEEDNHEAEHEDENENENENGDENDDGHEEEEDEDDEELVVSPRKSLPRPKIPVEPPAVIHPRVEIPVYQRGPGPDVDVDAEGEDEDMDAEGEVDEDAVMAEA